MLIDPSIPIGLLSAKHPCIVRLLENAGIDYHLGGAQTLRDACAATHTDYERMLALLSLEAGRKRDVNVDWTTAPLGDLIDHIIDGHHAFSRILLARIERALGESLLTHPDYPSVRELFEVFDEFSHDLLAHLDTEEERVLPYISALARHVLLRTPFNSIDYPIRIMHFDHESQEHGLAELRRASEDYTPPPGAPAALRSALADLRSLERDLHEHLHLENNVLFPRAVEHERTL